MGTVPFLRSHFVQFFQKLFHTRGQEPVQPRLAGTGILGGKGGTLNSIRELTVLGDLWDFHTHLG